MSRGVIFALAILAGAICVILVVLYWTGSAGFGHHADGPAGLKNFKHGVLFLVLAVLAFLFAAVMRPTARSV